MKTWVLFALVSASLPACLHAQSAEVPSAASSPLREQIKQLRHQSEANPGTPAAREAMIAEVFALARLGGDKNSEGAVRRRHIVSQLVAEEAVPREKKFELSALSANVDVATDRALTRNQRMARFAEVAWQLTRDFPENHEAYESLLRIARNSEPAQARDIVRQLLGSNAPDEIKAKAQALKQQMEASAASGKAAP